MEFFDAIKKRQSISKYKSDEVCLGSVDNMIDASMRSPSWKNKSSFKIIIVNEDERKECLAGAIRNRDDKAANAIMEAPLTAVFVGDPNLSGEVEGKEFYLVDGAIAMEHFILAATAEGYGTMWIAALEEDEIKKCLDIPNELRIIGITPVGVPSEIKEHYDKKDIKEYVFMNKFGEAYTSKN